MSANFGAYFAASSAMGSLSSLSNAYAQREFLRAQREQNVSQARINRQIIGARKKDVSRRLQDDLRRLRINRARTLGEQRANMAAQGIALDDGSALAIQEDTAYFSAMDEVTLRTNAWKEAWGLDVQMMSNDAQAAFNNLSNSYKSSQALYQGFTGAAQSGFRAVGHYNRYKNPNDNPYRNRG